MSNFQFVQNSSCEYFPCHKTNDLDNFNCLFCFCPLYALGDRCGGNFSYTKEGLKDCSGCMLPHYKGNYDKIMGKMELVLDLAKKKLDLPD